MKIDRKTAATLALGIIFLLFLNGVSFPTIAFAQSGAGWKEKWEKVVGGAKKEGSVVVWGPRGDLIRNAITQGFRKAFPDIDIDYFAGGGSTLAAKVRAERAGGLHSVDIILSGSTTAIWYLKPMGALEPIEPFLILPEVTDGKQWRDGRLEFADDSTRLDLVFVTHAQFPLIYNPSQVKLDEVDEIHELLEPKWKGKIVMSDPLPSGPGNSVMRLIWENLGSEKAAQYYKKFRAQVGAVDRDPRRLIEWVAQGRYALGVGANSSIVGQLQKRGLVVGIMPYFKDIGTHVGASSGTVMLMNQAPHPAAATVFINWLLSKDGQTSWTKAGNDFSRRLDVPSDNVPSYRMIIPGVKYWPGYLEKNIPRTEEEEKILKELFGK
jgi:ABC-type Fe3+ transport system substrate-binding protein